MHPLSNVFLLPCLAVKVLPAAAAAVQFPQHDWIRMKVVVFFVLDFPILFLSETLRGLCTFHAVWQSKCCPRYYILLYCFPLLVSSRLPREKTNRLSVTVVEMKVALFFFWREYSRRSDRMTVSDSLLPWRLYGVKKQRASEHRMVSVWMTEGERGGELRVPAAHREFLHVCPRVALAHVCLCVWCCHRRAPAFPLLTC